MTKDATTGLIAAAIAAREKAYCPYSGFSVGAAVLAKSGKTYTGFNIENASFPATVCAERTALYSALTAGEKEFTAIALAGGKKNAPPDKIITPCGLCRQTLSEFCAAGFLIVCAKSVEEYKIYAAAELLPAAFELHTR